jgi:small subunit ribosomal protein S1
VFDVKVVEFKPKRGTVVVSRRALLEAERALRRDVVMKTLAPGVVVEGTVKALVPYGAFIDLGGVDGLVRNEDLSWSHVAHPSQIVEVGESLRVQVLDTGGEKGKVTVGVKQLTPDPWIEVPRRYEPGKRVQGKVLRITDFGAFVELEPHVEGLVHVSEMSWSKRQRHPREMVQKGRTVDVLILGVEADKRRIALGIRQLVPNPWKQLRDTKKVGDVVEGPVRSVTDFGVFVEIADGVDGLVHAADMSWTERVRPVDRYKVGDTVKAVLLDVDVDAERVALGVKQLTEDPWIALEKRYPPGSRVRGKVARIVDFGAFVALEGGIDGLLHVSEMDADRPEDAVQPGQEIEVVVVEIDVEAGRVALSLRGPRKQERGPGPKGSTGNFQNTAMAEKLAKLKPKG